MGLRRRAGLVHDITAARRHALPALYSAAADGLTTLADPGYEGVGIGVKIPVKQPSDGRELDLGNRNALQRSLRCLGERRFALLNQCWRTLQHITVSPSKIGDTARAALVLTHFEHGRAEMRAATILQPFIHVGQPGEVAALAHFLASSDCGLIKGQAIAVDGGSRLAYRGPSSISSHRQPA